MPVFGLRVTALVMGLGLDGLLGDPPAWPHCVVGLGWLIDRLEKWLRPVFSKTPRRQLLGGVILVVVLLISCGLLAFWGLFLAYRLSPWLGLLVEALLIYQLLAARSLGQASRLVYTQLTSGSLNQARQAVGRIVGRDTDALDQAGIIRATVETVAENTSDGLVAPLFYIMLGGPVLGLLYKAINTMDSMLGYKHHAFLFFGRPAARLDDVANFLPARLTAMLLLAATALVKRDWRAAWFVFWRDRNKHDSPNAGQVEAVTAGALGIQLGGDTCYGGLIQQKATLGEPLKPPVPEDILAANRLLFVTTVLMALISMPIRYLLVKGGLALVS